MNIPDMKLHKLSGQGRVLLPGTRRYLYCGEWNSAAADVRYREIIAAWLVSNHETGPVTVAELVARFMEHAKTEYPVTPPHGGEAVNYRYALRPLMDTYATLPATSFTSLQLEKVRNRMVKLGWKRKHINRQIGRVRYVFRWAARRQLIPAETWSGLMLLEPLRKGRPGVEDKAAVKPVPVAHVEAIREHVSEQIWAMIEVLRYTGMRVGEAGQMRPVDLDMSGPIWIYSVPKDKTAHTRESDDLKQIPIGPRAQEALAPMLRHNIGGPVFATSKGRAYGSRLVRKLIVSGIAKANRAISDHNERTGENRPLVPGWTTHQLRHLAGTEARTHFGLDGTQARLGQSSASAAAGYGSINPLAMQIAAKLG